MSFIFNSSFEVEAAASSSANPSTKVVEAKAVVEAAWEALARAIRELETAMEVQVVAPLETEDESPLDAIQIDVPKSHVNAPVKKRRAITRAENKERRKALKRKWVSVRTRRAAEREAYKKAELAPKKPNPLRDPFNYLKNCEEYYKKREEWGNKLVEEERKKIREREIQAQISAQIFAQRQAQAEANQALARAIALEMHNSKYRRM